MANDPEYRQQYEEEQKRNAELAEKRKVERAFNKRFELTQDERFELTDKVESSIKNHLNYPNDAKLGIMIWECIDETPNGDHKRYVIDDSIKAMNGFGAKITMKVRAMTTVTVDGDKRTAKLEFVNLDGKSVYLADN